MEARADALNADTNTLASFSGRAHFIIPLSLWLKRAPLSPSWPLEHVRPSEKVWATSPLLVAEVWRRKLEALLACSFTAFYWLLL